MNNTNKDNKIHLELNLKFQMQDYRLSFLTKRKWLIAILLILVRLMIWHFKDGP